MVEKKYHALLDDRIFFGGAADAEEAVTNEKIDVVVDLRVKEPEKVTYYRVHAPIADEAEQVEASILEAVDKVVSAYRDGKKFFFIVEAVVAVQVLSRLVHLLN